MSPTFEGQTPNLLNQSREELQKEGPPEGRGC